MFAEPAPPVSTSLFRAFALAAPVLVASCGAEADLVVYVSHDQVHSEPLIRRFADETGLRVRAEYDIEASKTVGLVNRIRQERGRPRCDVFWNNEFAHTVALAEEGMLQPYDSPSAADIPATFRDPEGRWTGFAARARVFIVNTERVDPVALGALASLDDLFDERWEGHVGMARPLTGTTLTHAAVLFDVWGEERALDWLREVKRRNDAGTLNLLSGNGHVMRQVRDGAMAYGLTDTDDFNVARLAGAPVAAVYPTHRGADGEGGDGTLLIPNTVAILAEAPHPEAARRFVDWLLAPEVEAELARSRAAQIPVRATVPRPDHVRGADGESGFLEVDYVEIGRRLVERQALLQEMFLD